MSSAPLLSDWVCEPFSAGGITHQVFWAGSGPGVVLIHELPGITPAVVRVAEDLVAAGFMVALPLLVGEVGPAPSRAYLAKSALKVCISREFTTWATGKSSPVVGWLRALGRQLHQRSGGPGIGAIGMCFSGGFVLGMMVSDHLIAAVASQPSLPFAVGAARSRDLGISPEEELVISERVGVDCALMALRFRDDKLVGERLSTLRELCGDALVAVELDSRAPSDHSVLTEHRDEGAVAEVIEFLRRSLLTA